MGSFCVRKTGGELTTQQTEFVTALVHQKLNVPDAAKAVGVSRGTGYNWYNDDDVAKELQRQLRKANNHLRVRAAAKQDAMLDILVDAATTQGAYTKLQVEAAQAVLKLGLAPEAADAKAEGTRLEVIINNNTSDTAVQEQAARHTRVIDLKQPSAESAFELLEDE